MDFHFQDKKIAENQEAQDAATAARQKENTAWQAESEETKQAIKAMATAIGVLAKACGPLDHWSLGPLIAGPWIPWPLDHWTPGSLDPIKDCILH